jgi:hypothetical protein
LLVTPNDDRRRVVKDAFLFEPIKGGKSTSWITKMAHQGMRDNAQALVCLKRCVISARFSEPSKLAGPRLTHLESSKHLFTSQSAIVKEDFIQFSMKEVLMILGGTQIDRCRGPLRTEFSACKILRSSAVPFT